MTLILLGLGIFFLLATLLSMSCLLVFGEWRPYLVQIAGTAWVGSLPLTYLVWVWIEKRYRG